MAGGMKYFAMIDDRQCGPFTLEELPLHGVTPDTYVWCKGMADWEQAADVAEICRFYRQRLASPVRSTEITADAADIKEKPAIPGLTEEEQKILDEMPPIFRRIIEKDGRIPDRIPSDEEMELEPHPPLMIAILLTFLCFPPTGFVAIYYCQRTKKFWDDAMRSGKSDEHKALVAKAYDCKRQSQMWLGITFFLGMVMSALAVQYL